MCGFVGVVGPAGSLGDLTAAALERARGCVDHRGPDAQGLTWRPEDGVAVAFSRLRVLDLSAAADQPLWTDDRRIGVAFNGELYNFAALRHQLEGQGVRFRTSGDTEVFLQSYLAWGEACVHRFAGMWAAVVFDLRSGRPQVFASRDRMGEKPLYWRWDERRGRLAFASELAAVRALDGGASEVDRAALRSYLTLGYVPSPRSILQGVSKLEPGSALSMSDGVLRQWRWWAPPAPVRPAAPSAAEVRELVTAAVERRRVSDVPIGVLLSGGIDSTIVAGLLARGGPVRTFSAAYDIGPRSFKYNVDADVAGRVAEELGTDHMRFDLEMTSDLAQVLRASVRAMGEPYANPTALSTLLLAEKVRESGVTVVLTGDGSDELFGGYDRYRFERWVRWAAAARAGAGLSRLPEVPRTASLRMLGRRASVEATSPDRYLDWWRAFSRAQLDDILVDGGGEGAREPEASIAELIATVGPVAAEDLIATVDLRWWIPDESNARLDRTTMAAGVEARAVFEDHELVERVAATRLSAKVGRARWRPKAALVDAFADLLPAEVVARPKWGWISPVHYWVNDQLWDDLAEVVRWLPETGLFTPAVTRYVDRHPTPEPGPVWALGVFGLWYRSMIGEATCP
ncbi:MAG TPA: asparagine synthase (glutamine-hydrolyzing) [Acidimicrobiales bacterium]|nr:asparagine synthase (glutamine-hydrolyzing) [Acidimicrobiales bacterium]